MHNCKTFLSLQSRFLIYILARLLGEHNRKKGITEYNVYGCTLEYARAYILATQQTLRRGLKGDQFGKKLFFGSVGGWRPNTGTDSYGGGTTKITTTRH